jgi:4-amino-4-deoxychorismate lyase
MRGRALTLGLAVEADLAEPEPEPSDRRWLLLNSLGCRPLSAIDGRPRPHLSAAEAEAFWRQLL